MTRMLVCDGDSHTPEDNPATRRLVPLRASGGFDPHVALGRIVHAGGRAVVTEVERSPGLLAKVYSTRDEGDLAYRHRKTAKVRAMIQHGPPDWGTDPATRFAWPLSLLYEDLEHRTPAGFLMDRYPPWSHAHGGYERLSVIFEAGCPRLESTIGLYRVSREIARFVHVAHTPEARRRRLDGAPRQSAYALCDLKPDNILIGGSSAPDDAALRAVFVDCDSVQFSDGVGRYIGEEIPAGCEFATPELLQPWGRPRLATDRYLLAVLICFTLMCATHPFAPADDDAGDVCDRIRDGLTPLSRSRWLPDKYPLLAALSPEIRALAERCFDAGHTRWAHRPAACEWVAAIERTRFTRCSRNPRHHFPSSHDDCPWCAHTRMTGRDPFACRPGRAT